MKRYIQTHSQQTLGGNGRKAESSHLRVTGTATDAGRGICFQRTVIPKCPLQPLPVPVPVQVGKVCFWEQAPSRVDRIHGQDWGPVVTMVAWVQEWQRDERTAAEGTPATDT